MDNDGVGYRGGGEFEVLCWCGYPGSCWWDVGGEGKGGDGGRVVIPDEFLLFELQAFSCRRVGC